eukprot:m.7737 g.7737  ORF g.7737 m.7737 type:complete len:906 (+) comp2798_c0_seq1:69-2786(+)
MASQGSAVGPAHAAPPSGAAAGAADVKVKKKRPSGIKRKRRSTTTLHDDETRCICGFTHNEGLMICCDRCRVWQHGECVGIQKPDVPAAYLCDKCDPRELDADRAHRFQSEKARELERIKSLELHSDEEPDPWGGDDGPYSVQYENLVHSTFSPDALQVLEAVEPTARLTPLQLLPEEDISAKPIRRWRKALLSNSHIDPNTPLAEFKGAVELRSNWEARQEQQRDQRPHPYVWFHPNANICVDASQRGAVTRFVRRSCHPNARVDSCLLDGQRAFVLISISEIKAGHEVTIAHDFPPANCKYRVECVCRSKNCAINPRTVKPRKRVKSRHDSSNEVMPSAPASSKKMSREERKLAAILAQIERMEGRTPSSPAPGATMAPQSPAPLAVDSPDASVSAPTPAAAGNKTPKPRTPKPGKARRTPLASSSGRKVPRAPGAGPSPSLAAPAPSSVPGTPDMRPAHSYFSSVANAPTAPGSGAASASNSPSADSAPGSASRFFNERPTTPRNRFSAAAASCVYHYPAVMDMLDKSLFAGRKGLQTRVQLVQQQRGTPGVAPGAETESPRSLSRKHRVMAQWNRPKEESAAEASAATGRSTVEPTSLHDKQVQSEASLMKQQGANSGESATPPPPPLDDVVPLKVQAPSSAAAPATTELPPPLEPVVSSESLPAPPMLEDVSPEPMLQSVDSTVSVFGPEEDDAATGQQPQPDETPAGESEPPAPAAEPAPEAAQKKRKKLSLADYLNRRRADSTTSKPDSDSATAEVKPSDAIPANEQPTAVAAEAMAVADEAAAADSGSMAPKRPAEEEADESAAKRVRLDSGVAPAPPSGMSSAPNAVAPNPHPTSQRPQAPPVPPPPHQALWNPGAPNPPPQQPPDGPPHPTVPNGFQRLAPAESKRVRERRFDVQ